MRGAPNAVFYVVFEDKISDFKYKLQMLTGRWVAPTVQKLVG